MHRLICVVLLTTMLGAGLLRPGMAGQAELIDHLHRGKLAAGEWLIEFDRIRWVPTEGEVTGLAFGPGRHELAYCTDEPTGSSLWVASVAEYAKNADWRPRPIEARPRLLWHVPDGAKLSGIPWWTPDGSGIATVARRGDRADLVLVDYASGAVTALAARVDPVDVAWAFSGDYLAYVVESDDEREVWLQTVPPGDPRQLGKGGANLRWSVDGKLTWLDPVSGAAWHRYEWHASTGAVRAVGSEPARPPGAQWSPDGRLCALLVATGEDDEKQLVICPAGSTSGDVVPLPLIKPQRLLGWSPDSRMLLLVEPGGLVMVTAEPPAAGAERFVTTKWSSQEAATLHRRACPVTIPWVRADAPAPVWSSASDRVAYVAADEEAVRRSHSSLGDVKLPDGLGHIIVQALKRDHFRGEPAEQERERDVVVNNMALIGLALQMYLADNDGFFPPTADTVRLMSILDPYLEGQDVFMRPGGEGEICVEYLMPPGVAQSEIPEPRTQPVAIADCRPEFLVLTHADGHASVFFRERTQVDQYLATWWEQFQQRRREDPGALPPPFRPKAAPD